MSTGAETFVMMPSRASQRWFVGACAVLFAAAAVLTIVWCGSMADMGGMPMPGGWTMSMAWMRMPGQSWPGAAASFLGMWTAMMVAMKLPSLVAMLSRYRSAVARGGGSAATRLGLQTAIVGVSYFSVWVFVGLVAFPSGVAVAALEMEVPALARAVPTVVGVVVAIAGLLQFTRWKARHLTGCMEAPGESVVLPSDPRTAWKHGLRLGVHCACSSAGMIAVLLVVGVMDLWTMAVVAVALTGERLAPNRTRAARVIGVATTTAGLLLLARG